MYLRESVLETIQGVTHRTQLYNSSRPHPPLSQTKTYLYNIMIIIFISLVILFFGGGPVRWQFPAKKV